MSEFVRLLGFAVLALGLSMVTREAGRSFGLVLSAVVAVAVTSRAAEAIGQCVSFLTAVSEGSSAADYIPLLLKACGVAYLTDFTAGLCRSAGEGNIGTYVELAGRAELLLLAIPLVGELLSLSFGVLAA